MRFEDKYKLEDGGENLVLEPQGDSAYYFRGGFHGCGTTKHGISIEYMPNRAGGVLTLDDIVKLRDFLNKHLEEVLRNQPDIGVSSNQSGSSTDVTLKVDSQTNTEKEEKA